jgi:DNA-binding NarL/FixJ family response regulator
VESQLRSDTRPAFGSDGIRRSFVARVSSNTIIVADAQSTWRLGFRTAFEREGFAVVAEAATAAAVVRLGVAQRPDACVVDVRIPGGGVEAARRLTTRAPATSVVVLAEEPNDGELIAALRAGASGYLPKALHPSGLVAAVRGVLEGESAIPRRMVPSLVDEVRMPDRRRPATVLRQRGVRLTPRECQVFDLLARDAGTRDIAADLGISVVTVRRHVSELLHKLGVEDRAAARRLFRETAPRAR